MKQITLYAAPIGVAVMLSFAAMLSVAAQQAPALPAFRAPARSPAGHDLSWAFHETNGVMPREAATTSQTVPGSVKTYTRAQIDDMYNAVDWFPDEHPPPPEIVLKGHGTAHACGVCHLMSGFGHPESADVTGLPVEYFRRTMREFKNGSRVEPNHMNEIAKDLSEEEINQTADWYGRLKPARWTIVKETGTVPQTWVPRGRMRFVRPEGGAEPLGTRIIVLSQDPDGFVKRDPHVGFIAYVPVGSIEKGAILANTGGDGKTVVCSGCHGEALKGLGSVPRLAGLHPAYIARQLYLFQDGRRHGADAGLMKRQDLPSSSGRTCRCCRRIRRRPTCSSGCRS